MLLNIVIKKYFSDVFKTLTVSIGKCFSNVAKNIFNDIVFLVLLKRFVNVIHPVNTKHIHIIFQRWDGWFTKHLLNVCATLPKRCKCFRYILLK